MPPGFGAAITLALSAAIRTIESMVLSLAGQPSRPGAQRDRHRRSVALRTSDRARGALASLGEFEAMARDRRPFGPLS